MDIALSFQKKRNETMGLGGVPALRASCLSRGCCRHASKPDVDAQPAGEACSRGIVLISITPAIDVALNWPTGQGAAGAGGHAAEDEGSRVT
ncbi:hypothetical protein BJG93_35075 [Paraburkholderia sprentiae WSM5005]|uniref:Uncharacterized protein n=1 Tax=Paraburkholderia sprentiae WSM5005 TaxID=754502 RepID=A0A8F4KJL7_9BURK|nr:hypothetical protein [Paraburkholderia sprentiae]QXE07176.1 hypothetical protein BJG93_35075 [Paraburkholderia sprentiae WSM5005]